MSEPSHAGGMAAQGIHCARKLQPVKPGRADRNPSGPETSQPRYSC